MILSPPSQSITLRLLAMVFASMMTLPAQAQDNWKLAHEEAGIKVFTRPVEGSDFLEFKGEMVADATLQEIAGLILSVPHMTEWMYGTKKVKVLSMKNELDRVLYMVNDAPFPLRDRDLVVHNVMEQRSDDSVVYTIELLPDREPDTKYVHVKVLRARVTLTPMSDRRTHIEYTAHVDPGGIVPAWAVNMFVVDTPSKTLEQARALIKSSKRPSALTAIRKHP